LDEVAHLLLVADVGFEGFGGAAAAADVVADLLGLLRAAEVVDGDAGAARGQGVGDGRPQAARRAGHQRYLAAEGGWHLGSSSCDGRCSWWTEEDIITWRPTLGIRRRAGSGASRLLGRPGQGGREEGRVVPLLRLLGREGRDGAFRPGGLGIS